MISPVGADVTSDGSSATEIDTSEIKIKIDQMWLTRTLKYMLRNIAK